MKGTLSGNQNTFSAVSHNTHTHTHHTTPQWTHTSTLTEAKEVPHNFALHITTHTPHPTTCTTKHTTCTLHHKLHTTRMQAEEMTHTHTHTYKRMLGSCIGATPYHTTHTPNTPHNKHTYHTICGSTASCYLTRHIFRQPEHISFLAAVFISIYYNSISLTRLNDNKCKSHSQKASPNSTIALCNK